MSHAVQRLAARLDVQDAVSRLFWYVDECAWAQLAEVFTEQIRVDYTSLFGGEAELVTAAEQARRWSEQLGALTSTQHIVTSVLSRIEGDEALCTANVTGHLRRDDAVGGPLWRNGGTYSLSLRQVDGRWRVSGLRAHLRWSEGNPAVLSRTDELRNGSGPAVEMAGPEPGP
ncbi:nuclear transport factor 2 family protein [Streptomyces uncialis]|uniref:nuclear transport factor 2 family protein n=1 Tax=Streptomyces uncialis TaxID=1048205 RepID=UPI0033C7FB6D